MSFPPKMRTKSDYPDEKQYAIGAIADKIDWEGGITETIAGYGLTLGSCIDQDDRLEWADIPEEVFTAWGRIAESAKDVKIICEWLEY